MTDKKWEELQIKDDFMFGIIMRNPEICRMVLERILEIQIERVEYPEEQKSIRLLKDAKSVRLDVYVKDNRETVYNVEIQTTNPGNLEKRSRYYQGMIDLNLISQGESYTKLNQCYIIFICTFDPFGEGWYRYTFENRCRENKELVLQDEATRIFLNTKGTRDDVSGHVKRFLHFLDSASDPDPGDDLLVKINQELENVRKNQEWRREYMTLLMELKEREERGKAEGRKEGRKEERKELVRTMRKNGISPEQIAKLTGISLEEIRSAEIDDPDAF